jgi:hypothetical protein
MLTNAQLARLAGALYLVVAVCGASSQLIVRSSALVAGDAPATAANIRATADLFRIGFVTDLVNAVAFVLVAFTLYVLLSPVNHKIAATFVIFNAIAATVMAVDLINHAGALIVATDPSYAATLGAAAADSQAALFLELHRHGYLIAQVFFGLWLLPLGYLVYRSGIFPRVIGVLLMLGCFGYLADVVAIYTSPALQSSLSPYLALPAGLAELVFLGWLLIVGIRTPRQVAPASAVA